MSEIEWTTEMEIALFQAMEKLRPIGIHKHFRMINLTRIFNKRSPTPLSTPQLWDKIGSLYNLNELEKHEDEEETISSESLTCSPFDDPKTAMKYGKLQVTEEFCLFPIEDFDKLLDKSPLAMQRRNSWEIFGMEGESLSDLDDTTDDTSDAKAKKKSKSSTKKIGRPPVAEASSKKEKDQQDSITTEQKIEPSIEITIESTEKTDTKIRRGRPPKGSRNSNSNELISPIFSETGSSTVSTAQNSPQESFRKIENFEKVKQIATRTSSRSSSVTRVFKSPPPLKHKDESEESEFEPDAKDTKRRKSSKTDIKQKSENQDSSVEHELKDTRRQKAGKADVIHKEESEEPENEQEHEVRDTKRRKSSKIDSSKEIVETRASRRKTRG